MKKNFCILTSLVLLTSLLACAGENGARGENDGKPSGSTAIAIRIGDAIYTATIEDNETARALLEMLPLALDMHDVNNNEKCYYFSDNLPSAPSNPETIYTGDIMLWGSNCLVLFYKTFRTTYGYTRIGRVDDPQDLDEALGAGTAMVKLDIIDE